MTAPGWPAPRIGSLCTGYGGLDLAVIAVLSGPPPYGSWSPPPGPTARKRHEYSHQSGCLRPTCAAETAATSSSTCKSACENPAVPVASCPASPPGPRPIPDRKDLTHHGA